MSTHFRTDDFILPESVGSVGPTGTLVTLDAAITHLDLDASEFSQREQLETIVAAATDYVERAVRYSFRERQVSVLVPGYDADTDIWLPWGDARALAVTLDSVSVPEEGYETRREGRLTILSIPDTGDVQVRYTAGSRSGPYPPLAVQAVLHMTSHLWLEGSGETKPPDPRILLPEYDLSFGGFV